MKKLKMLCLLLCLFLTVQLAAVPVLADETEPGETLGEEADQTTEPGKPAVPEHFTIPQSVSGDASVSHGCHTLGGKVPLHTDPELAPTAKGAFLFDKNTDTVLYSKNPDQKLYPASLTKAVTCLIALENGNLDDVVTVTESALANMDPDGSSANLQVGEQMPYRDLLYCLMVESANDAGAVLAEYIAGSEAAFADLMNQKAEELGCTGTHFSNPHGLHDEQHYTTARDMARILDAATDNEQFRKISGTSYYKVPATNLSEARELYTTNLLLGKEIMDYYYDERVKGGKTGYTSAAGRCLMTFAEDEESDLSLLTVVMGTEEIVADDGYTVLHYGSFEETENLLEYGFENFTSLQISQPGQAVDQFQVLDGANDVAVEAAQAYRGILPADYREEFLTVQAVAKDGGLQAPVAVGDSVGAVRVWYRDICLYQTDALSLSSSGLDVHDSMFSGGILTEEEDDRVQTFIRAAGKIFVVLVLGVVLLTVIIGIKNTIVRIRRRKRRKNHRRSR